MTAAPGDGEIRAELARLKDIVAERTAPGAPDAVHTESIGGARLRVFSGAPANLGRLYRLGLEAPDRDFLVYRDERYSFARTLELSRRLGRALVRDCGVRPGDRVAICARNCPEWCLAWMAATLTGAVAVPLNAWWRGPELEHGLRDSGSSLVFADRERLDRMLPFIRSRGLRAVLIRPGGDAPPFPELHGLLAGAAPLSEEEIEGFGVTPEHDASIMYTSGSTGEAKGVLSTHRAIINALYTWKFVRDVAEVLRPELAEPEPEFPPALLANVPLFHVTGSHAQFLASFVWRRKFVMMRRWDADRALELIEAERISIFHGVPTMTWDLMQSERFGGADLRSLRSVQSGGAPRPPEHLAMMLERFPEKAAPGLGYGLTETNAIGATISGPFYAARPASTGRPSPPVTDLKIADGEGRALAAGEAGEVCIRGPTVMKGYWNRPRETAEVLEDGWLRTGDIGRLDALGFLFILDRAKDIVLRGGENISCTELEYAIHEHPAVSEASVYGLPDPRLGEVPAATVALRAGRSLDRQGLEAFLAPRIAAFKLPARVHFQRGPLPRTASGKIARKALRRRAVERMGPAGGG